MLDLTIFRNRLFAAATAAAFINGLSRFALMFLFVFYFQGVKGDDPMTAGIKLAPLAIGMLIASPLAGSGRTATGRARSPRSGCSCRRSALAGMTTLEVDCPTGRARSGCCLVGVGSGMFNSPNTAAMMGTVPAAPARDRGRHAHDAPEHRRGDLDRLRDGHRDRGRAAGRCSSDLLRPHERPLRPPARSLHPQHAHRAVGAGRDLGARRVVSITAPAAHAQARAHARGRTGAGERER